MQNIYTSHQVKHHDIPLVQFAVNGCQDSLAKLFALYEGPVRGFISKKCFNQSEVDDLLQDTFLQAMLNISRFRMESKFSTWVMGIALNVVRNHCNRSHQYRYDFVDETQLSQVESEEDCEKEAIVNEFLEEVMACLEQQPDAIKDIVMAVVVDGLPYQDIADADNISVQTVKSRVFRLRKILKNKFGDRLESIYRD